MECSIKKKKKKIKVNGVFCLNFKIGNEHDKYGKEIIVCAHVHLTRTPKVLFKCHKSRDILQSCIM